jgi:hypothetical protein
MRLLALVLIFVGCDAPYVEIAPADTSVADTAPDAFVYPDASKTLPDGAICSGHDEDLDGWPDTCDVCPGIHDTLQEVGDQDIGTACEVSGAAGTGSFQRLFFDPLISLGDNWISGGPVAFGVLPESPDKFTGGSTTMSIALALAAPTFDTKTPLVVTAAIESVGSVADNRTGVFLRGSPGGDAFIGCGVRGASRLGIVVATGCLSDCDPVQVVESDPFVVTRQQQAIRMVARERADGGADIDCWVFDTAVPEQLTATGFPYKITATVDATQWGTNRPRVGIFAKNTRASVSWFEVLSRRP